MRKLITLRLRYLLPVIAFIALAGPAWAILFYTFLPSNGAGKAAFSPPRRLNPADVAVPAGKPVTLVFHRETDETCAKEVVLELDGKKLEKELPLHEQVEIAATFPKAGKLTYACGMDMVHGTITVQ